MVYGCEETDTGWFKGIVRYDADGKEVDYITAYNDDEGSCSESFTVADFDDKMHQAAYSMIRMALIIQADLMV